VEEEDEEGNLVRYGEILLKGLNRPIFEDKLMSNIKRAIHKLGKVRITKSRREYTLSPWKKTMILMRL